MQQMSGFWLRHGADGALEQIDLIFPWHPPAGAIPGIEEIADCSTLPPEPSDWRSLPVRHVAFPRDRSGVTLYASAPPSGPWPENEAALQRLVRQGAAELNRDIEQRIFARLPPPSRNPDGEILDQFYGGAIATWRRILGPELHYHAGLFETPDTDTVDDAAMTQALRRAVTELYRFMPPGSSVYDIGCGWGGPLAMLVRDQNCRGLGLTISRTQFRHVASLGLPVRLGDAERTLPPGPFDCALLLELFCHIADKAAAARGAAAVRVAPGDAGQLPGRLVRAARLRRHHAHGLVGAIARTAARGRLAHPPLAGSAARGLAVRAGVGAGACAKFRRPMTGISRPCGNGARACSRIPAPGARIIP